MPRTSDNTTFKAWWKAANRALETRGLRKATLTEAADAFAMGESPDTFADYVRFTPEWQSA